MTVVFQLSRSAVCDCHKMSKSSVERFLYLQSLVNSTSNQAAPQALPPNVNQRRDDIVSSASERRPDLTTSARGSGFSFGGSETSVQSGSTPTGGFSFGGSATSVQSGSTPTGGFSFGGSATSVQFGIDVKPYQPPSPRTDNTRVFMSREDFDKICAFKENETDDKFIDLTKKKESKNATKRESDEKSEESATKKIKSDGLPLFAGKGLFQYVYMVFKNSTGVKKTNVEANPIWGLVKTRQTYFDKLAIAFKNDCIQNGVTKGSSFDKKRNALAKRLSEIPDMCTDEEGKWKAPTQSHEALFK